MPKTLVAYYSHTGNNLFLAHRIARHLDADLEEIRPRLGLFAFLILFTRLKWSPGIRPLRHDISQYDRLIILGPIWFGMLISPMRDCIRMYRNSGRGIHVVTCCGGHDGIKDEPYGYEQMFRQARNIGGEAIVDCTAFPVGLLLSPEDRDDHEAIMQLRLSEENFTGEIRDRLYRAFPAT